MKEDQLTFRLISVKFEFAFPVSVEVLSACSLLCRLIFFHELEDLSFSDCSRILVHVNPLNIGGLV